MSLKKVVLYVLRVRNMHPGSPSDPSGTAVTEAKPRYVYSVFQKGSQTAVERGKAEMRILDFKTTWSESWKNSTMHVLRT